MSHEKDQDLRYPIGPYVAPAEINLGQCQVWIAELKAFPGLLQSEIAGAEPSLLNQLYRPGGWTVRQVVHHLADSHANAYIRFRLALTEPVPLIKAYAEADWAELPDAREGDIKPSLLLLEGLHARWAELLKNLPERALERSFEHPQLGISPLKRTLGLYAWHGRHHLAHIANARRFSGHTNIVG